MRRRAGIALTAVIPPCVVGQSEGPLAESGLRAIRERKNAKPPPACLVGVPFSARFTTSSREVDP
jgi:hypothetical protein